MVTDMNQPLGRVIGNSLEIEECIAILKREDLRGRKLAEFADCESLSVELAGTMIWLGGKAKDAKAGVAIARELLESGAAWKKFEELVKMQGGSLEKLPRAKPLRDVVSASSGYIHAIETEQVGYAALVLGAGRQKSSDVIDPVAGIEALVRLGDKVNVGTPLYRLYGAQISPAFDAAASRLLAATRVDNLLPSAAPRDLIALRNF
jgi:pyrimidine-nucleoside phosphorylase